MEELFKEYKKMICPYCNHYKDAEFNDCEIRQCINGDIKCCFYDLNRAMIKDIILDDYTCKPIKKTSY